MKHAEAIEKRSSYGSGKSSRPTLPNLIVPGVQKSGTSALCEYLRAHPQCVMSVPKEPHFFFCRFSRFGIENYRKCFSDCDGQQDVLAVGEA